MKHIAAYLLLVLGGNTEPSAADVSGLLSEVGIDADAAQVEKLVSELTGKNLEELIAAGMEKVGSVSVGGGAAAGGAAAGGAAEEAAAEEEEEEEEEADMGTGGLFDDSDDDDW